MPNLTYSDAITSIERNNWFRDRVREATSVYSNYFLNTPTEDPDYTAKINNGKYLAQNINTIVDTLMVTLSGDTEVLAGGPAIPDTQLQLIVEKTIQKFWPMQTTPAGMMVTGSVSYPPPPFPPRQ